MKGYVLYSDVQDRITSLLSIEPEVFYIVTEHTSLDGLESANGSVALTPDGCSVALMTIDQCMNWARDTYSQHYANVSYAQHPDVPNVAHLKHKDTGRDLWLVFRKVEIP